MGHHRVNSFFLLRYHYLILFSGGSMQDLWMGGRGGLWIRLWYMGWIGTVGKLALPIPPPPPKFEASLRPCPFLFDYVKTKMGKRKFITLFLFDYVKTKMGKRKFITLFLFDYVKTKMGKRKFTPFSYFRL